MLFYYCSLSVYSFVGVLNNFDEKVYAWIEKYIHILVHIYPISSALYLVSLEAFNNVGLGYCLTSSEPLECMNPESGIPCERGPSLQEWTRLNAFWSVPFIFYLICPTVIMVKLFCMVKKRQTRIYIQAKDVAKQSFIYLFALQWVIWPFFIQQIWTLISTTGYSTTSTSYFIFSLVSSVNLQLFGLWSLLTYLYFSVNANSTTDAPLIRMNSAKTAQADQTSSRRTNDNNKHNSPHQQQHIHIFSSQKVVIDDNANNDNNNNNNNNNNTEEDISSPSSAFSFNIFDGTNASRAFAEFIHGCDSDDEQADNRETLKWRGVQNQI